MYTLTTYVCRYTMLAVFPILYVGYKVVRKTKIHEPKDVDLYTDLDVIEEYERNYVPQPARYAPCTTT